ncbi:MAG: beta-eliminating lyase-related protein [Phenylobacterium sp.]|uniref:threonine aldolase family protein n=1 Tax=Phenylobacterium sp. TaxID=1871053 RepID=UPI002734BB22|nr:beta-eliminating lyase-related protein [Phenylobacterium sp.]MDP1640696.1 beta-eliminating lyase-related protein [Phenylobacterium sp.]MDP3117008.1 beta-eliminating lyase-related protein [Phenylobacterium sp.]
MSPRYDFASDNTAPAAPEAMAALNAANAGFAASYGADATVSRAADLIRGMLDADAEVRFVTSGTAANAICLAALARPFEGVLAHRDSHVATDETGAPGFFGHGLAIQGLEGASGRIDPQALEAALAKPESAHAQPPAALSLTHATEYGTVYSTEALAALTRPVRERGYGVHLDGARLANAAAAGFDLKSIAGLGVDLLVIGGTKAGMTPAEAIVIFRKDLVPRFDARLKQSGQLPSKSRFYAAPFVGMLESGAFVGRAAHANAMARRLAELMPLPLRHPVEANAVFVEMDEATLKRLHASGWFVYRFIDGSVRFMCSWATTIEAIEALIEALKDVLP